MAQHPFAAKARQVLEANGVVFNPDGSTTKPRPTQNTTPQEENQQQVAAKTTVEEKKTVEQDEREKIIAMQRQELEQLRTEKQSWVNQTQQVKQPSEREVELEQQLADLRSQLDDKTRQEQADEVRLLLEREGFDSENLDDEVMLEIRDTIAKPIAGKLGSLEDRLSQFETKFETKFKDPTPEELLKVRKQETQDKVIAEIPDFFTVFNSKDFQDRLKTKDDRFPSATYGHALQIALEEGNSDFIIREIKSFLNGGQAQTLGDVADVSATNGVGSKTSVETKVDGYTYTPEEAIQMLRKRQMGDISKQEYSEYRAKLDANRSR